MRHDIDLKYFKNRLEKRLKEITAEQQRQKDGTAPVELDQARVGRLSRMDAMQQQAMAKATARLTDLERQRIQSALLRIRGDEYGYCVICEDEIAEGRLQFDPSVLLCISCAEEREAG
ncbi:MAG: TraR/DksA C4-type zinc finger protein [Deltaproteobacteria bacterium]|nr:TraR/DksA C4-type zinc finger protein [Deltaproteobacteria bacterium]